MSKKEFLYSREYESDEVGYRITITTTDYSLYNAVKKYAESIFNAKEADDIEHKSFECCSCVEHKGGEEE